MTSARSVSIASRIGIPARTKAASWREKFMISARFTFFGVISIFQKLGRSLTRSPKSPCSARATRASLMWSASTTPLTAAPSAVTPAYLYFAIALALPRWRSYSGYTLRRISGIVVTSSATRRSASSRRGRIPSLIASLRSAEWFGSSTTSCRIASVMRSTS